MVLGSRGTARRKMLYCHYVVAVALYAFQLNID